MSYKSASVTKAFSLGIGFFQERSFQIGRSAGHTASPIGLIADDEIYI
jgi:hypothetical protein